MEMLRPMPSAFKRQEVYVANRAEVIRDFPEYIPLDQRSPWVATAIVPTLGKHVFVFRLQFHVKEKEPILLYFKAVGAILSFYEFRDSQSDTRLITKSKLQKSLLGQNLTPRQFEILELIGKRNTNAQIADVLGYSESLIKQESMIIYAKLGVSGRQEILHSEKFDERISSAH